ncbi:unnamed protein product, partial [Iphiclides podalirius]
MLIAVSFIHVCLEGVVWGVDSSDYVFHPRDHVERDFRKGNVALFARRICAVHVCVNEESLYTIQNSNMNLGGYEGLVLIITLIRAAWGDNEGVCNNESCDVSDGSLGNGTRSRPLSRTKRFIVFPDGSSFQLVFCVQTMAVIPIGDIFLFGNTAALAWNLPSDPKYFNIFKKYEKHAQRRGDSSKHIYYLDDTGKVLAKVPFKRPVIVNPAFAKRSTDDKVAFREKLKIKIDRMKMHEKQSRREFLNKEHLDKDSVDFHRKSRVELFEKIETLMNALGRDGRRCVLYKLCESAQSPRQGTFLQELFRVVFTLPKGPEFDAEEHKDYDKAHTKKNDCTSMYAGCEHF